MKITEKPGFLIDDNKCKTQPHNLIKSDMYLRKTDTFYSHFK